MVFDLCGMSAAVMVGVEGVSDGSTGTPRVAFRAVIAAVRSSA